MSKKILIVGGTGYIGGALVKRFAEAGHKVRVFARHSSNTAAVERLDAEILRGRAESPEELIRAAEDCCCIINLIWTMPPKPTADQQFEADAPVHLNCLNVARAMKIKYISTSGNFSLDASRGGIVDERLPDVFIPEFSSDLRQFEPLIVTNWRKDQILDEHVCEHGVEAMVVLPGSVYGAALVPGFWDSFIPTVYREQKSTDFVTCWIHVDDVAATYVAALEKGRAGGRYLAGGETLTLQYVASVYAKRAKAPFTPSLELARTSTIRFDDSETRKILGLEWRHRIHDMLVES